MNKMGISKQVMVIIIAATLIVGLLGVYYWINLQDGGELKKITFQLNWQPDAYHAGVYVALGKGYFAEEGLEPEIVSAMGSAQSVNFVATDAADIGIAGASYILQSRGKDVPIKATMMIFQSNPVYFLSLADKEIIEPEDFVGKKVGIQEVSVTYVVYQALMAKLGINRDQITEVPISFDEITPIATEAVDVVPGYLPTLVDFEKSGFVDLNVIRAVDYDINLYDLAVIATEPTINGDPEMVQGVVRALKKGYEYAIEHPGEAIDIMTDYVSELVPDTVLAKWLIASENLLQSETTQQKGLGYMDEDIWNETQDLLYEYRVLDKKVNINETYTNQFLQD
jgi:ABC-type nitrate/sulfonate/bicarbonate transport system substrate-binding protein